MSTNGVNTAEDADMAECEEEKVVTMMDVLQEQQEFEDDANAVLGASDEKNCTYSKGYIKRQAIYACLTCCDDAKIDPTKRAGVCLACSLTCHENHELVELYTKRNFRCDCGNPKFNGHPCQFVTDKPDINEDNSYNQNFSGLYCTCHRPYPDPEATFEDEMIQCIVCEDWLHAAHLEASLPTSDYAEMICKTCMDKNTFLHDYGELAVDAETENVDVVGEDTDNSIANNISVCNGVIEKVNGALEDSVDIDTEGKSDVDMAESDKDKTITTEDDTDIKPIEPVSDTNFDENKDVSEQDVPEKDSDKITEEISNEENSSDDTKITEEISKEENSPEDTKIKEENSSDDTKITEEISKEENSSDDTNQLANNDNNDEKTTESKDSVVDSSTIEANGIKTEVEKEESNDNSLLESIEKLENELGNIESKENIEENKNLDQTDSKVESNNEEKITENPTKEKTDVDNSINDQTATENVESNSKLESEEDDKQESVENKDNDVEMSETVDTNKIESRSLSDDKNDALESVSNGTDVPEALNSSETKTESTKDIKRKLSTEEVEDNTSKKPKLDSSSCIRPKGMKSKLKGATFWPSNFRQKLCTCNECISMYKDLSVLFLMDPEDTVTAYEALGKQRSDGTTSQYEKGLEALSSLDRIQQINALTEYNKMRDKLLDYLKSFKDRKEVVKEEDIKAFFAGMKPKRESDGVYFCR